MKNSFDFKVLEITRVYFSSLPLLTKSKGISRNLYPIWYIEVIYN